MQAGEKNYLQLFDAIDSQKEYDEARIQEKFRSENFTRRFAFNKHYLYALILKSLRVYHENRSVSLEIKSSLESAHILFSKGLLDQAMKMTMSAKKQIEKYEKIEFKPETLILQKGIMNAFGTQNYSIDELQRIHAERKNDLAQLAMVNDYEILYDKVLRPGYTQTFVRQKKQLAQLSAKT